MAKLQPGERLYRGLTSTRAVSVLGVAIWLPLGLLRAIYRQASAGGITTVAGFSAVIAVTALAAVGASWLVSVLLLRNQQGYRASILRTFIVYVVLLVIVDIAQEVTERAFDLGVGFSPVRMITGLVGLYLVAFLLDSLDRYRDDIAQLNDEQHKLSSMRKACVDDLARMRSLIVSKLRSSWNTSWEAVHEQLLGVSQATQKESSSSPGDPSARSRSAADLHGLADQIRDELISPVRTLSYEVPTADYLRRPEDPVSDQVASSPDRWIDWREVGASIPTQHPFYPFSVPLLLALFSISNVEMFAAPGVLVGSMAIFMGGFLMLFLAKKLLGGWLSRAPAAAAWLVWILIVVIISAILIQLARWPMRRTSTFDFWLFSMSTLLVVSVIMIWSFITATYSKVQEIKEPLRLAAESTRREAIALEQEVELTKQEVAHVLHGEVQSMLTAAAFRLDLAAENVESGGTSANLLVAIDEAQVMLRNASRKVDSIALAMPNPDYISADLEIQDQVDVRERIDDVRVAWSGIVEIEVDVDDGAAIRLGTRVNDASLAPVVTDIVREAVLNAARHAHAAHMWVTITQADGLCHIQIANDGESPTLPVTPGMGFGMLERLECGWSLDKRIPHGSILTVELPFLDI